MVVYKHFYYRQPYIVVPIWRYMSREVISRAEIEKFIESVKADFEFMHPDTRKECEHIIFGIRMMVSEIGYTKAE